MIKIYKYPDSDIQQALIRRPVFEKEKLDDIVLNIIRDIKNGGDNALFRYSRKFDNVELSTLKVSQNEIDKAYLDNDLKKAIELAKSNIERFHSYQNRDEEIIETTKGVKCWRKSVPIEKVGLYIPGGSAPLFSTVLMLGIPAKLAGCKEIILCTPPGKDGSIHPAILFTASLIGIDKIFKVGGAQAIAAMAFGTETIPQVYKIFGPGNQFVTKAKEIVQNYGLAIDIPAGPSEVLVIADDTANPEFVAADLLSQAEHGEDSQVVLLSDSEELIDKAIVSIGQQIDDLPRKEIASIALENSFAALFSSLDECIELSNQYAPEHLIINTKSNQLLAEEIVNAGSVFLGNYSCESIGDYASGTNHTLPTNGFAKNYSGVSLDSFMKKITFQELSEEGIKNIGPAVEIMANAEQLYAHKNAVTLRLNKSQ